MRIIKLRFEDKTSGWVLDEMAFHPKLTLLVGASGVGKTQILRAVKTLAEIAGGEPFQGIAWDIEFETIEGKKYQWVGEYETDIPLILEEELTLEGEVVWRRTKEKTYFKALELPKISRNQSLIGMLKNEDNVAAANNAWGNVLYSLSHQNEGSIYSNAIFREKEYMHILEGIEKKLPLNKLLRAYQKKEKIFNVIMDRFHTIFPTVENIVFSLLPPIAKEFKDIYDNYQLQLKEKGVPNWIPQNRISSGMYKTLIHLAELYLCADGTVFLIDEFENSLGINCINEITADIINSKRQIQFIITSHHPYIINSIDFEYWKLVTRNGNVTRTHNAADLGLGKSKHERFMQLLQLEEYQTGSSQN